MAKWGGELISAVPGTDYFTAENDVVVVSREELRKLRSDSRFLQALMDAGVDNWEGYAEACTADDEDDE